MKKIRRPAFRHWLLALPLVLILQACSDDPRTAAAGDRFDILAGSIEAFIPITDKPSAPPVDFLDIDGKTVTLDKFAGKVVLVNLWATWCPPCIHEMPDLNALQLKLGGEKFVVVAVASGRQGAQGPTAFLEENGWYALTTYLDPRSRFLRYLDLSTLPTSLLIDRDGKARVMVKGIADWDSPEIVAAIESLM